MFLKGQRKDDLALAYLAEFTGEEGVLFVGRAQEKTRVFRTEKRRNPDTGASHPWIVSATGIANHFYVYAVDAEFGPFFIKFCSYFPYTAKLCFNGNEYAKRMAAKAGIGFTALDNGFAACADRAGCSGSATGSARRRSTRCCARGCGGSHSRVRPYVNGQRHDDGKVADVALNAHGIVSAREIHVGQIQHGVSDIDGVGLLTSWRTCSGLPTRSACCAQADCCIRARPGSLSTSTSTLGGCCGSPAPSIKSSPSCGTSRG
jgi:hypothetical protein